MLGVVDMVMVVRVRGAYQAAIPQTVSRGVVPSVSTMVAVLVRFVDVEEFVGCIYFRPIKPDLVD